MKKTITKKTIIKHEVELPALVSDLAVPAGFSIDRWEREEKKRLSSLSPVVKGGTTVLGPETRELFVALRQETSFWDEKRRLLNLLMLEQMGYAQYVGGDDEDDQFAVRRMYNVAEHPVTDHIVNAIWPK